MSEARSISRSGVADRVDLVSVRTRRRRWSLRQLLIALAAGLSLILAGLYGDYWWTTGRFLVTTDDAYVDAHSALISPKVSGYISDGSGRRQPAGQGRPGHRPHRPARLPDRARPGARQCRGGAGDDRHPQPADRPAKLAVEQARQQVASDQAALVYSQQDFQRYTELAKRTGYGTVQQAQQAQLPTFAKQAKLDSATRPGSPAREKQIAVLRGAARAGQGDAGAAAGDRAAGRAQPRLHDDRRAVRRHVGVRTVHGRPICSAGHAADGGRAAARGLHHRELHGDPADRRAGRPAGRRSMSTPSPGSRSHGHVESLAPASGQQFALLPPDNATGNFTKIVQRIPVKIALDTERSARSAGCARACRSSRRSTPSRRMRPPQSARSTETGEATMDAEAEAAVR